MNSCTQFSCASQRKMSIRILLQEVKITHRKGHAGPDAKNNIIVSLLWLLAIKRIEPSFSSWSHLTFEWTHLKTLTESLRSFTSVLVMLISFTFSPLLGRKLFHHVLSYAKKLLVKLQLFPKALNALLVFPNVLKKRHWKKTFQVFFKKYISQFLRLFWILLPNCT